jgi:hypothetical protein
MSATFSKQEHTVVNIGEEENPRLITCVKASQGFDWNMGMLLLSSSSHTYHLSIIEGVYKLGVSLSPGRRSLTLTVEIFLPSYADYHFDDLERRQDPVEDIILTEEEVRNMVPQ